MIKEEEHMMKLFIIKRDVIKGEKNIKQEYRREDGGSDR